MLVQGPNLQGQGLTVQSDSHYTTTSAPSTSQPPTSPPSMQANYVAEEAATLPYDSPLPRVHSLRSDEGSMTLLELMVLCTILSKKVESLESDLKQTKLTYGAAFIKLIMKVKRLEKEVKLNKARRRAKIVVSDDEDAEKDTSKQGRSMIKDIDHDAGDSTKILADVARVHTYSKRRRTISTSSGGISTAEELVSTVGASMPVSTTGMDQESIPSPSASKDKGKVIMTEFKTEQAPTKLKQRQERMAQVHQAAQGFIDAEWDDIWARVAADEDLVQQLQAGEKYSEEDLPMKLMELVNQRKKFFAQQRAEAKRNKPMTPAQQKATMRRVQSLKSSVGGEEQLAEKEKELSEEELQKLMMIVLVEEVYIIRVGDHTEAYQTFDDKLKKFNRDDLDKLWSLVKEGFSSTDPTGDKERIL
ncbi:hypothetical protein Tco_1331394 [Tanacetum coccineum]